MPRKSDFGTQTENSILLIGGGGHCKSCIDVNEQEGRLAIAGIVDKPEKVGEKVLGYPVIGTDGDLPALLKSFPNVLLTLGQIKSPARRIELFQELKAIGAPVVKDDVGRYAEKAGLYVLTHTDEGGSGPLEP